MYDPGDGSEWFDKSKQDTWNSCATILAVILMLFLFGVYIIVGSN